MSYRSRPSRRGGGPPSWLVFLAGVALVFGIFYVFQGLQTFLQTGGLGVVEATRRAEIVSTATVERVTRMGITDATARPTATPPPTCVDFRVSVPNAIVRGSASPSGELVRSFNQGTVICVLGKEGEWYIVDSNPDTRRHDIAYMHETVIEAVNPTLTPLPSVTPTPTLPPSVTPTPSDTPAPTLTPSATATLSPRDLTRQGRLTPSPSPEPTLTPSSTGLPMQSA
jgi:hypothetical protein